VGPTQPLIHWVPEALSLGVKRLGRESDNSPPSSAEVKNGGAIPPLPNMSSWHRDNFTFYTLTTFARREWDKHNVKTTCLRAEIRIRVISNRTLLC
jgi:hypothetical protein